MNLSQKSNFKSQDHRSKLEIFNGNFGFWHLGFGFLSP